MKGEKICQHKTESGDPSAIKVGRIFVWHLFQWPAQRCNLRHLAAYRWYYTVANSQMPYLWHRTEGSDLTKLSGQRWKLNIGYINVRLCIQEKIIQTIPNNVYFRTINYTLVESWIHHWQLHEILSACKQQPKNLTKHWACQKGYWEQERGCNFADPENSAVPTSSLPCTVLSPSLKKNVVELWEITEKGYQNDPGIGTGTFSKTGWEDRSSLVWRGERWRLQNDEGSRQVQNCCSPNTTLR